MNEQTFGPRLQFRTIGSEARRDVAPLMHESLIILPVPGTISRGGNNQSRSQKQTTYAVLPALYRACFKSSVEEIAARKVDETVPKPVSPRYT